MFYRPTASKSCRTIFLLSIAYGITCTHLNAEVITDGTVGAAQTLVGPNFLVPQSLGSTTGNNLFHSFHGFNIANTESATFTGANSIRNVISRVTGGQSSTIDGLLRSEIGHADFYFINPAGVIFGPSAQMDVPAAFHVSTAGNLQFSDGAVFNAIDPAASTLSMASPSAFGFLADRSAAIRIEGSQLRFNTDSTISLSGGEIVIDSGTLISDGGEIHITGAGPIETLVPIDSEPVDNVVGDIRVNASRIEASGNGAGRIVISGGDAQFINSSVFADNLGNNAPDADAGISANVNSLLVNNSFIFSNVTGKGDARNVDVSVTELLNIVNGGQISSSTFSDGNAGNVAVQAKFLNIDGLFTEFTGIASQANPGSSGDAGNVDVSVTEILNIVNGGQISSSTFSDGNAGNAAVQAKFLNIDGLFTEFTGITSQSNPGSSGDAGNVDVSVTEILNIVNGGQISSSTFSGGDAGNVAVQAKFLNIDGLFSQFTGITSQSNPGSSGDAGNVDVSVTEILNIVNGGQISSSTFSDGNAGNADVSVIDTLNIVNGGQISSSTFSNGNAGNAAVQAKFLNIDGMFTEFTGIASQANPGSNGDAGSVDVSVTEILNIVNGGQISSSTFSDGNAGNVAVQAKFLNIDGMFAKFTGIASQANPESSGDTGNVSVNTNDLTVTNGGSISIRSDPFIDDPEALALIESTEINIQARNITLNNNSTITAQSAGNVPASNIFINAGKRLSADNSQITTAANQADGGSITVTGGDMILTDSQITTSVAGNGNGGDIFVTPKVLVLDTGFIQANTSGAGATGGDIQVDTEVLIASSNNLITGGDTPLLFQAGSGLNVIQAAAPDGVSGSIDITSPELNISGTLINLDTELVDIEALAKDPCASPEKKQSILISAGRGGTPESAKDAQSIPINNQRLERILSPQSHQKTSTVHHSIDVTDNDGTCGQTP